MAFTGRAALAAESVSDASMSEDCFAPQAANVRHNTPASRRVGTEHCNFSFFIFYIFYNSFLNYFYLFRKDFMTSKSAKSNVKFLEVL